MGYWTRFFNWCQRPDMIKFRSFNPSIGERDIRTNPLQMGISVIMGWTIWFVVQFITPGIYVEAMFWVMLLLGLSLTSWGIIEREKTTRTRMGLFDRKTMLQTGVVVTIIWAIILVQRNGPLDLGLPKLSITIGYDPRTGTPINAFVPGYLLFVGFPALGLILVALGIILKSINRRS